MSNFKKRRPLRGRLLAARRGSARCDFITIRRQSKGIALDELQMYAIPDTGLEISLFSKSSARKVIGETCVSDSKKLKGATRSVKKYAGDEIAFGSTDSHLNQTEASKPLSVGSRASSRLVSRNLFVKGLKRRDSDSNSDRS